MAHAHPAFTIFACTHALKKSRLLILKTRFYAIRITKATVRLRRARTAH